MEKLSVGVREKVKDLDHQALHAWKIELKHPVTKKKLSFEAELPEDLKDLLKVVDKK
jgi:23S rRNA-/tRNA-specific pseudouridylate synthase